jgi:hypothetical protein
MTGRRVGAGRIGAACVNPSGQCGGWESYFFENVRHGILTPDDGEIWRIIEEQSPCWLNSKKHKKAVDILRSERATRSW